MTCEIGLFGLAVMGQNLALNIAEKGFKIGVCNRSPEKVDLTLERAKVEGLQNKVEGYKPLKDFVAAIKVPRKIILLVKAGDAVDQILASLEPLLAPGDLVIDGGNEWYENTERRTLRMESLGFKYMGMGVSGGEEGARHGPALMPGGSRDAYTELQPIVERIAAIVDGKPCVSFIGPGGAGNYVKMVHNGIEYGDMQLIAEAYECLRKLCRPPGKDTSLDHSAVGLNAEQLHEVFTQWNSRELQSFLIEITADIFSKKDSDGTPLVEKILDVAGSKGTGMWTVREAALRGIPCPTISAALDMRMISAFKKDRRIASEIYGTVQNDKGTAEKLKDAVVLSSDDIADALYCSKICSYAQGMMLLLATSETMHWNLDLATIAQGWRGGCIIRAVFLDRIHAAYSANPNLPSLLLDPSFSAELKNREKAWRRVIVAAQSAGLAVPALAASLAYFDAYRSALLPLNLVQAQRDYFGAHTYRRIDDEEGPFVHTQWTKRS